MSHSSPGRVGVVSMRRVYTDEKILNLVIIKKICSD